MFTCRASGPRPAPTGRASNLVQGWLEEEEEERQQQEATGTVVVEEVVVVAEG